MYLESHLPRTISNVALDVDGGDIRVVSLQAILALDY